MICLVPGRVGCQRCPPRVAVTLQGLVSGSDESIDQRKVYSSTPLDKLPDFGRSKRRETPHHRHLILTSRLTTHWPTLPRSGAKGTADADTASDAAAAGAVPHGSRRQRHRLAQCRGSPLLHQVSALLGNLCWQCPGTVMPFRLREEGVLRQIAGQHTGVCAPNYDLDSAMCLGYRAVHRSAPDAGDVGMTALIASWLRLPQQPVLQHTLAMAVSVYTDWLAASLRLNMGQELPPLLLQLLGQGDSKRCFCCTHCSSTPSPHTVLQLVPGRAVSPSLYSLCLARLSHPDSLPSALRHLVSQLDAASRLLLPCRPQQFHSLLIADSPRRRRRSGRCHC